MPPSTVPPVAALRRLALGAAFLTLAHGCSAGGGDGGTGPTQPQPATLTLTVDDPALSVGLKPDSLHLLLLLIRGGSTSADVVFSVADTSLLHLRRTDTAADQDTLTVHTAVPAGFGVVVHFGWKPGAAVVRFRIAGTTVADSVVFTLGGVARSLEIAPSDTAAYVGHLIRLRPLSYAVGGGYAFVNVSYATDRPDVIGLEADGRLRALATGRAHVTVSCPGPTSTLSATMAVSVVPHGMLTAWNLGSNGVVSLIEAMGTPIRTITPTAAYNIGAVAWLPGNRDVIYHANSGDASWPGSVTVFVADTAGHTRQLFVDSATGWDKAFPAASSDGAWVYYQARVGPTGGVNDQAVELWRVKADGTAPERVGSPADSAYWHDTQPAVSPDGALLAYTSNHRPDRENVIRMRHLGTGVVDSLEVPGCLARWSPQGDVVAYLDGCFWGSLALVRPDGTGRRLVTDAGWRDEFGWSPDGQWLVGVKLATLTIVNVATGEQLPVVPAGTFTGVTWRQ